METVDYPTFVVFGVFILRFDEYSFNGCVSFEVYPNAIFTTDVLETFCYSFCIWYDYLSYCGLGTWPGCICTCTMIVVGLCLLAAVVPCLLWLYLAVVSIVACVLLVVVAMILLAVIEHFFVPC